jgi:hypothetical protein
VNDHEKLIWCAGFFDGEGCISVHENVLAVRVVQKHTAPLETFQSLFGGVVGFQDDTGMNKITMYHWRANGLKAKPVLWAMLPYLTVKKAQAVLGIEFAETIGRSVANGHRILAEDKKRRQEIYLELKELKRTGA